MSVYVEVASLLIDIEAELRRLRLWDAEPPTPQALASTEPFCVDTLTLPQWLQFIFLPRMYALMNAEQLPPGRCEIKPLAEEFFGGGNLDVMGLMRALGALDHRINTLQ
ncbi:MAG: pseudouridine synthase [Verrucomicrobiaceae bacterium]|nr:pseudouridine synthase [Verrucomicrobiaceae bacterium]